MSDDTERLRHTLIDQLEAEGFVQSEPVERAMRAVPRHVFAPWLSLEAAYENKAHTQPESESGRGMSTISQPGAVALMLEPLGLRPGMRVLEVGAGTGYNAALISSMVGSSGHVVTVDIEDWTVERARRQLEQAGFGRVEVICGDGGLGYSPRAPYDRIVATVGLWEIPPAWFDQLAPDGQIATPLHLGGPPEYHHYVMLEREGNHLSGTARAELNMVLMRGDHGAHPEAPEPEASGPNTEPPKRVFVKVFRMGDPDAPEPQPMTRDGQRARKVFDRRLTRVQIDLEL